MDLRLHDPQWPGEALGGGHRFLDAHGGMAGRDRNAELGEKLFGLIFMDIHLGDGIAFDIFDEVEINTPVIFCTAFYTYYTDAFKKNGIDKVS